MAEFISAQSERGRRVARACVSAARVVFPEISYRDI
jgi:hypothetical protein